MRCAVRVASVPVRCISVDSLNHLYLCGKGFIPSHNTEAGNNWIGYVIHHAPGPMLAVQPTVELAKRFSRGIAVACDHQLPGDAGHFVGQRHGGQLRRFALEEADNPGRPAPAASYMLDDGGRSNH